MVGACSSQTTFGLRCFWLTPQRITSLRFSPSLCYLPLRHILAYCLVKAITSAGTFTGSWDMKGGEADALTAMEKTLLKKKLAVTIMRAHLQQHISTKPSTSFTK